MVERWFERKPQRLLAQRWHDVEDSGDQRAPDTGQAKFSRCTGGNADNGGDFERATDPWVSFSPNGVAHQVALGINDLQRGERRADFALLSTRAPTGRIPVVVKFDDRANFFNDKETLTADPTDSDFVYVTWQRIVAPSERASARAGERAAAFRRSPGSPARTTMARRMTS